MGLIRNFFRATWWTGSTFGTSWLTHRHGRKVGSDAFGNSYYQHKANGARRWVVYDGSNDGSRVPPGWMAWLRGTIDDLPEAALPERRAFETPAVANITGTPGAYRPSGVIGGSGRPAATGDYQAWKPE